MESSDINQFWDLEIPSYQNNRNPEPIGGLSPFNPFELLPDPLLSDITTPSSSESTELFPSSLTEEEAAHVDSLLFFSVESPVLPPDIVTVPTEMVPALDPMLLHSSDGPSTSSVSPLLVNSGSLSSTAPDMAPSVASPTHKRCYSLVEPTNQSQPPTPGPSVPRPRKRYRTSHPGESSFQLDPTVVPRPAREPANQPVIKPHSRPDYSACRCPARLTSNRARHWRSCPNNPDASVKRFTCEICGTKFTREDNKKRHTEDYH